MAYISIQPKVGQVSLVIGVGLATPGDILKCLALGADAVILGTVACLALSHTQVTKAAIWTIIDNYPADSPTMHF